MMTVNECYAAMEADYDDVISRLRTDERITKFLLKFLDDPSFSMLETALEEKDVETAFRAAHTIKGVCMNLSISKLFHSSQNLTEALRGRTEYGDDLIPLFEKVKEDYEVTVKCIEMLM